jgi:hypothetical protein
MFDIKWTKRNHSTFDCSPFDSTNLVPIAYRVNTHVDGNTNEHVQNTNEAILA